MVDQVMQSLNLGNGVSVMGEDGCGKEVAPPTGQFKGRSREQTPKKGMNAFMCLV